MTKMGNFLSDKEIFDNDLDCAKAFAEICPIREKSTEEKNSHVDMMELGVDLSHLYPKSVNEDKFTIVLIDTPGMDSAQSSEDGRNKHKEIALDAISMKNKPMIVLCADAAKYEDKNIGEFMSEIISQSKEDGSGFNDRFLFLMNKCDGLRYNQGESAEKVKRAFAKYLTDSSKWNIERDEEELKQLADSAANFVPRVFMTAARVAFAIQCKAYDFSDEELNDSDKYDLLEKYDNYKRKICDRKFINFYLSKYCDIPNYRKDEIEAEFKKALDEGDDIRATELQCGIVSVETAIKDYIERYAYPIKVRGLLDTFEDILEDVNGFTNGILADLKNAKKELGEKTSDREEAKGRKKCVEEKSTVLNSAKEEINKQLTDLDYIKFDSVSLKRTISDFRADIELDREIKFIRSNPVVKTTKNAYGGRK